MTIEERMVLIPFARMPDRAQRLEGIKCAFSFRAFLRHWHFKNRETGEVMAFGACDCGHRASLWDGQRDLAEAMEGAPWLFALKAGKLGFSELACAYDGWVARFGPPNARVHLFSYGGDSAAEIFSWVRFGLEHLPAWMKLPAVEDEMGADTGHSLKLYAGPTDTRRVVAYKSKPNISIDQTCNHAHLDEFTRWPYGERTWNSVQSTIAPDGSCHIITRGNGPGWSAEVYRKAKAGLIASQSGVHKMRAFFAPFFKRPGRGTNAKERAAWKQAQSAGYDQLGLKQWAPETEREALQGGGTYVYPMFENPEGRHVVKAHPWRLEDSVRVGVSVDPGGGNPTSMGLWGENSAGRYHRFTEFYVPNVGSDEILAQIAEWYALAGSPEAFRIWVPADNEILLRTIQGQRYDVEFADKHKADGIQLCIMRLQTDGVTFHESCTGIIAEMPDYRWQNQADAETKVIYTGDRPIKHHADACDDFRYAMLGFATWPYDAGYEETTTRSGRRVRTRR